MKSLILLFAAALPSLTAAAQTASLQNAEAFYYQIAKDAGAMAAVLCGKVDQIILTGGIAYSPVTKAKLEEMIGWIAPFTVYPGEDELLALAQGALRVMRGEEAAKEY